MERRQFAREFKLEAVRLNQGSRRILWAASDLDVHASQLRDWVKKFSDDALQKGSFDHVIGPRELRKCLERSRKCNVVQSPFDWSRCPIVTEQRRDLNVGDQPE